MNKKSIIIDSIILLLFIILDIYMVKSLINKDYLIGGLFTKSGLIISLIIFSLIIILFIFLLIKNIKNKR